MSLSPRRVAILAALGAMLIVGGLSQAPAQAGCITTLPMSWSLRSNYAASWVKTMRVDVRTNGPAIRNLSVTLSTFNGDMLGKGFLHRTLFSTGNIRVKLKYPMQPGRYTLYFLGEPNADPSCGPKHTSGVIRLVSCVTKLPVTIVNAPQGYAQDYGNWYSFDVRSNNGQLMKNLTASLSTFGGQMIGKAKIRVLFGEVHVSIPLSRSIQPLPQQYTLNVAGYPPGRPQRCGPAHVSKTLRFRSRPA